MCELTLCDGKRRRLERTPRPFAINARTAGLAVHDVVASVQARLDATHGLWSSRRVRAALCEQLAPDRTAID